MSLLTPEVDLVLRLRGEKAAQGAAMPSMSAYQIGQGQYGMEVAVGEHGKMPTTNDALMSIRFIFAATHGRDREGDLYEVSGMDTKNHRKGPGTVLIDHGKWCPWPVGKTKDAAHNYTVYVHAKEGLAECDAFMSSSLRESDQAYKLYKEEILSSGSVGYRIILARPLPPDPSDGHFNKVGRHGEGKPSGLHLVRTELLEPSLTAIPINADCAGAVRKAMGLNWGTGGISDYYKMRWQPWLTGKRATIYGAGFSPRTLCVKSAAGPAMSATSQSGGGSFVPPASPGPAIHLKRPRVSAKSLTLLGRKLKRKAVGSPAESFRD
jgi:hypothetical protein